MNSYNMMIISKKDAAKLISRLANKLAVAQEDEDCIVLTTDANVFFTMFNRTELSEAVNYARSNSAAESDDE